MKPEGAENETRIIMVGFRSLKWNKDSVHYRPSLTTKWTKIVVSASILGFLFFYRNSGDDGLTGAGLRRKHSFVAPTYKTCRQTGGTLCCDQEVLEVRPLAATSFKQTQTQKSLKGHLYANISPLAMLMLVPI